MYKAAALEANLKKNYHIHKFKSSSRNIHHEAQFKTTDVT
jgi:hypothetical protein